MYIKVNNASILYWMAKRKYKYLGFLNFIASLSIRVCINIRIQPLVIQTCIEKASCNIKYYTTIYDTQKKYKYSYNKYNSKAKKLVLLGHEHYWWYCNRSMGLTDSSFFATGWFDTYFLEINFDDPTNYRFWTRPQYGSSLELWILSTSIDTYTKWQMSISYGKTMKL